MKHAKIVALVLSMHLFVVTALLVQPGCKTHSSTAHNTSKSRRSGALNVKQEEATAQLPKKASVHPAFNAGMSDLEDAPRVKGSRQVYTASQLRSAPTRPTQPIEHMYSSDFNMNESLEILEPLPGSGIMEGAMASAQTEYKVRKGDSLWVIARTFGVSLEDLLTANNLRKNAVLRVGQELIIPSASSNYTSKQKSEPAVDSAQSMVTYSVERGDTLSGIASKTSTSVSDIKQINNLRSDVIYVGQKLKLPAKAGASVASRKNQSVSSNTAHQPTITVGKTYQVRPGDSLSTIAQRTHVPIAKLVELNNINDPRRLQVGQILQLAEKTNAANVSAASKATTSSSTQRKTASQDLFDDDDFLFDDDETLFGQGEEIPLISIKG